MIKDALSPCEDASGHADALFDLTLVMAVNVEELIQSQRSSQITRLLPGRVVFAGLHMVFFSGPEPRLGRVSQPRQRGRVETL